MIVWQGKRNGPMRDFDEGTCPGSVTVSPL